MFSFSNPYVVGLAVLFSMCFIGLSVFYVNKLFANNTKDVLVRFILVVFASLVAVFIVDKVVAFKINLLNESQNKELFDLIKTLVLMIFSYYFGTQKSNDNETNKPTE
jgi:uncharacterized membrane protein YbjE (DUF340 family)